MAPTNLGQKCRSQEDCRERQNAGTCDALACNADGLQLCARCEQPVGRVAVANYQTREVLCVGCVSDRAGER